MALRDVLLTGQAREQRQRLLASGTPRGPRCPVACPQMIEAPHAASRYCEIEEHEAVDDSQLTRVQERKEAPRRVRYEVCDGHVARQDECDRTCEQAEHNQHPPTSSIMPLMPESDTGATPVEGETGKLKYFDVQDTQHTRGPRCEKAVDRRHHNFSYERPEACQPPVKLRAVIA
jgi:hypothetical protein